MCGIVGILANREGAITDSVLKAMTRALAHRGPDGEGFYRDGAVALGHRRLAVIDLSDAAAQPMKTSDGRYVIAYNGEVYNFRELRKELQTAGHEFFSQSDTEVVLHALIQWDVQAISKFNGMFAFLFYDKLTQRVLVARDRYGIKPLYVAETPAGLLFGSEIKAFLKHPEFNVSVNLQALNEYFTFQNMLSPETLFRNVRMMDPGTWQEYEPGGVGRSWKAKSSVRYWDYNFTSDKDIKDPRAAADILLDLFSRAVDRQMVSDVPLGSYLSGGVDSGSIVALASRKMPRLTTFTGGFDLSSAQGMEAGYDERAAAEVLSNQFKTEHYEMVMHAGDMAHAMPDLIWHLEDLRLGQCYPNFYLSRLASKFVKVVLCGAGGDELFAGYPWRYFGSANCHENGLFVKRYYDFWQRLVSDEDKKHLFHPHVAGQIDMRASFDAFGDILSALDKHCNGIESNINRSLYFEAKTFLHGLLMLEDKLSMAHSLETRVPFLDNDLVDFACRIPVSMKLNSLMDIPRIDENELGKTYHYQLRTNDGKRILRQAIEPLVPPEVADRAKQGFSSPDVSWYRGESLDYVKDLLTENSPCIYEYIAPGFVKNVLTEHMSGHHNHRLLIWSFLSFEWWLRIFVGGEGEGRTA
jgi:asparagine synthase (glutamine-hydrolysing)